MFCRICGKPIPDDSDFCANCGAATPPSAGQASNNQKPARKTNLSALIMAAVSMLLAAALLLSFLGILPSPFGTSAATSAPSIVSQGFETPEEAIESFVEFLQDGDIDGVLSTCAIENMAQGFDYTAFAHRLGMLTPIGRGYLPAEYLTSINYNELALTQELLRDLYQFTASFNAPYEYHSLLEGYSSDIYDDSLPDLIASFDLALMSSLEIVEIKKVEIEAADIDMQNRKEQSGVFGAEDVQCRTVLYQYEDKYYIGGFSLIQYNGKWQVQNMSDYYSGAIAGPPIPIDDKSEFYDFFD